MPFRFADAALKEFNAALDDVSRSLLFVSSSARIRPRLGGLVDWKNLNPEARTMIQGFIRQKEIEVGLIHRGFLIVLAGTFEYLVRRLIQDAVIAVNKATPKYDGLYESIRFHNTYRTGQALATIAEPIDHYAVDYHALGTNLATCVPGSAQYTLNAEAFTIHVSNVSPRHIIEAFKRLGVSIDWNDLGQIPTMRAAMETKDTVETARATEVFLRDFIKMRNKIAHTGSGGIAITETEINQTIKFFRVFGANLALIVTEKLSKSLSTKKSAAE